MKKIPKFIIGDNPMGKEQEGTFIVHLHNPVFSAEIFEHRNKQEQSDFHDEIIQFQEEQKIGILVGRDRNFKQPFTLLSIGDFQGVQETADELAAIMREMADWYQKVILWEEEYL